MVRVNRNTPDWILDRIIASWFRRTGTPRRLPSGREFIACPNCGGEPRTIIKDTFAIRVVGNGTETRVILSAECGHRFELPLDVYRKLVR